MDQLLAGATSDVHFLMKLVAAAPCSFAAVAASVQHFLAELVSAAPCRFFGPIVDWQVAPAASAGAVAGAAAAGAGAGACANAAPVTKSDAATIAIILIFSLPGDFSEPARMPPRRYFWRTPFGLALSTISGRYCAMSFSTSSTGNPIWRAKVWTSVLPSTAFN